MSTLSSGIQRIAIDSDRSKHLIFNDVAQAAFASGYVIDDVDLNKPWGWYVRFESTAAESFIADFFPGLSYEAACLGNPDAQLSPKILLVSPGELLSWQYHDRRAERWAFVTPGAYHKSLDDNQGELHQAGAGEVVQFAQGERHRLVGVADAFVLVAEIWQHTDKRNLSDEADIIRLDDKYKR